MAADRPFRFGAELMGGGTDANGWRMLARKAEALGYATLVIADHPGNQLAPIPAMLAAADATSTLRVGSFVLANDLRHPAVLAKDAATVDRLSDGRLELGIGAGWDRRDYERLGVPFAPAATRVDRLVESVAILKAFFEQERFTFAGRHYSVRDLDGLPRPVQRPRPPILVGGGSRRVLSFAAREADIIGLNPNLASGSVDARAMANATAEATAEKITWIRSAAAGRLSQPELNIRVYHTAVSGDRDAAARAVATATGLTAAQVLGSPHMLIGTTDQIADDLMQRREQYGLSYFVVTSDALETFAPVVARLANT
jgi:probable F420-dependent oxidoreductase